MSIGKPRLFVQLIASSLVVGLTACATSEFSAEKGRNPATERPSARLVPCEEIADPADRRFCALVEKDSIDALGLMVTDRILGAKWEKVRTDATAADEPSSGGSLRSVQNTRSSQKSTSNHLSGSVALRPGESSVDKTGREADTQFSYGMTLFGSSLAMIAGTSGLGWYLGNRWIWGAGTATLVEGQRISFAVTGAGIGLAFLSRGFAESGNEGAWEQNQRESFLTREEIAKKGLRNESSFRLGKTNPDSPNTEKSRGLEAERLKESIARDITERATALLDLRTTQKLRLQTNIENELDRMIAESTVPATKRVKPPSKGEQGTLALGPMLAALRIDVEPRMAILNEIMGETKPDDVRFVCAEAVGQRVEALRAIDHEIEKILAHAGKLYAGFDTDAPSAALEKSRAATLAFIRQCGALRSRVRAHLAFVPATEGKRK